MRHTPLGEKPSRLRFVLGAVGLYAVWTFTTYLLEGRTLTFLRPEATGARLAYAVVANLLVGVVGAGFLLRSSTRGAGVVPQRLGLRSPCHTVLGVVLGLGLGCTAFVLQQPSSLTLALVGNAFAQVWVVSVAEVLVCWVALGKAIEVGLSAAGRPWASTLLAWAVAAVAFGAYHFAHSPPFNTMQMVGLLTGVGLITGAFFFIVGEVYGTILFHNFLALQGVTEALAAGGKLEPYTALQPSLIVTALMAAGVLVAIDLLVRR